VKLPDVISLFPLPNVVLFPRMPLPLHVFEPRYRAMVRDAIRGGRLIGMVLLRGDWEREYHGRPPIFATGTVGEMVRVEELSDGRFNIVLRGLREYVIEQETERGTPYREARVAWRGVPSDQLGSRTRNAIADLVRRYLARLGRAPGPEPLLDEAVDDETFVNFFAQHLELAALEKQALLEAQSLGARAARLCDVLEFQLESLRVPLPRAPGRTH
jgi:Lon protease-like protein